MAGWDTDSKRAAPLIEPVTITARNTSICRKLNRIKITPCYGSPSK